MKHLLVVCIAFTFLSCTKNSSTATKNCQDFLMHLYNENYEASRKYMDEFYADSASKVTLSDGLRALSKKIRIQFETKISVAYTSSETTFHENLPATFLIFKVESKSKFGYYYFYVNELTNKILLVSEFTRIKQKR